MAIAPAHTQFRDVALALHVEWLRFL